MMPSLKRGNPLKKMPIPKTTIDKNEITLSPNYLPVTQTELIMKT
jgi:hypothetical protein